MVDQVRVHPRVAEQLWRDGVPDREIARRTGIPLRSVQRLAARMRKSKQLRRKSREYSAALTDEGVKAAVNAWVQRHGLPCTPRRWTDTLDPETGGLAAISLIQRYGSWAQAMKMAGVPYDRPRGLGRARDV